jgi:hypothetical protein
MYLPTLSGLKTFDDAAFAANEMSFASAAPGTYVSTGLDVSEFAEYFAYFAIDNAGAGSCSCKIAESNDNVSFAQIPDAIINISTGLLERVGIYVNRRSPDRKKFFRLEVVVSTANARIFAFSMRMSPMDGKIAVPGGGILIP